MRLLVTFCAIALAVPTAGCADDEAFLDADSKTCRAHGTITDVSREPSYSADNLQRWATTDGCAVRLDVLMTSRGDDSCGGEELAQVVMGTPLGSSYRHSQERQFIRDPNGVLVGQRTSEAFDPSARRPRAAEDTGFRQDGVELWMLPGKNGFVYLVDGDHVEAWPRVTGPVAGCA